MDCLFYFRGIKLAYFTLRSDLKYLSLHLLQQVCDPQGR